MDEDKTQAAINLGQAAASLLSNEAFQAAREHVKKRLMERWELSTNKEERDRIWHLIQLDAQYAQALTTFVSNGRVSKGQLDELVGKPNLKVV